MTIARITTREWDEMRAFYAAASIQIQTLTEQMRAVTESQKADDTDRYVELRRGIKVIGLTEILAADYPNPLAACDHMNEYQWEHPCAVLFERYGHLQFDGKPLWSKPPTVSDITKQMIAEALRRRQSEEAGAR